MKKIAIILGILFIPNISSATPSIGNVSGTFSHGNSITISGSGFGTKSPAKPLVWADFEGGAVVEDNTLSVSVLGNEHLSASSAITYGGSGYAVRGIPNPAGTALNVVLKNTSDTGYSKVYQYVKRYYDHATWWSGITNYKTLRFWPNTNHTGLSDYVVTMFNGTPPPLGYHSVNEGMESGTKFANGTPPVQSWNTEEQELYHGTLNNTDGTFKYWENGTLLGNKTFLSANGTYPTGGWKYVDVENYWTLNPPPVGAYVYFDDYYVDNTWARSMICSGSTWAAKGTCEIQIPTAWSASSITAYFNQGSFSNGQSVYLFVVDSDGNASLGKAITIGGAADSTKDIMPNPPARLIIN